MIYHVINKDSNIGETMSKWFFLNGFIFILLVCKLTSGHIALHKVVGGVAFLFVLYNWTRHAVFTTIRSNISRQRKIKYAQLSKKLQPVHKWTGTTALIIALLHAAFIGHIFGIHMQHAKMVSGLIALLMLCFVVLFGWIRHMRTTVVRRYLHWGFAYALIVAVVIHLLL